MNLDYKVDGYYFDNGKKGFYSGKIDLISDNRIIGLIEDQDYKHEGKRFIIGFYYNNPIQSIIFIKTPKIEETTKRIFLYSLTNNKFDTENFDGIYEGFWIGIEPDLDGEMSKLLKINQMSYELKKILKQKPTLESLDKLKNIDSYLLKINYFKEITLNILDSIPSVFKERSKLLISKV
ncbi:MAG: hypothetical protein AABW83_03445 [Nanoarchaeota archaeon]